MKKLISSNAISCIELKDKKQSEIMKVAFERTFIDKILNRNTFQKKVVYSEVCIHAKMTIEEFNDEYDDYFIIDDIVYMKPRVNIVLNDETNIIMPFNSFDEASYFYDTIKNDLSNDKKFIEIEI